MQNTLNSGMGSLSDKEAQKAGFKSAAEMKAFHANRARMRKRGGDAAGTTGMGAQTEREKRAAAPAPKKKGSPLSRILGALGGD